MAETLGLNVTGISAAVVVRCTKMIYQNSKIELK